MNGTERNILAFAYAKTLVRFYGAGSGEVAVARYGLIAPKSIVLGVYETEQNLVAPKAIDNLPILSMESDEPFDSHRYFFYRREDRDWLAIRALAAITLWHHRWQRELETGARPDWRTLTAILDAADHLKPGGSPVANAARVVTMIQRRWSAERRRRGEDTPVAEGGSHA